MTKKDKRTRLKLIVNPSAGNRADTKSNLNAVTANLEANGFKVDVAWAKPKEKATPLARKAIQEGYKLVAAMGGDGTVEAVMRGLTGSHLRLGILPTGIQNNIARSLGIPLDLEQACRLIASDATRKVDVGQVRRGKGDWFPYFEMVGVGYAGSAETEEPGEAKPQDDLFRSQIAASPEHKQIVPTVIMNLDDDQILEVETRLLTICDTPIFGNKFIVPAPEFLQDGLLDISIFQGFAEEDVRGYYSKMKAGVYAGIGNVQHYQASKLTVRAWPPMEVIADGISLGKGTVSVRMRPGALCVIAAPESRDVLSLPRRAHENDRAALTSVLGEYPGEMNG